MDLTSTKPARPSRAEALALLGAEPLALAPSTLRTFAAEGAFWGWDEDEPEAYQIVGDGLAVITVRGCLWQRGCWWWSGYDTLEAALTKALLDGRVTSVVLAIDSPGGVVAGLFDAVKRMRAQVEASGKRVVAVSDERCYSAAYALACVADAIVVPETAGVGSVGVIGTMVSWAAALVDGGIDVRVIVSGAEKADGHPAQPLSDGAVAREQARVDQLANVFFEWVASRRPLDVKAVAALEAGIRLGPDAVTAKLADRVGTLAAILGGELTVDECCAHLEDDDEEIEVNEVPVPAKPGEDASRAESATRSTAPMKELTAILAALGAADAAQGIKIATEATSLRTKVRAETSADTDDAALGTLAAWKRDAGSLAELRAELAKEREAAAANERKQLLAAAVASMRLTPAEAEADGQPDAFVTGMSNTALRAFAARPATPVNGPRQPAKLPASAVSLTEDQRTIADQLGVSHEDYAKALAAQG